VREAAEVWIVDCAGPGVSDSMTPRIVPSSTLRNTDAKGEPGQP
jgi:hypothetical protein